MFRKYTKESKESWPFKKERKQAKKPPPLRSSVGISNNQKIKTPPTLNKGAENRTRLKKKFWPNLLSFLHPNTLFSSKNIPKWPSKRQHSWSVKLYSHLKKHTLCFPDTTTTHIASALQKKRTIWPQPWSLWTTRESQKEDTPLRGAKDRAPL